MSFAPIHGLTGQFTTKSCPVPVALHQTPNLLQLAGKKKGPDERGQGLGCRSHGSHLAARSSVKGPFAKSCFAGSRSAA